jgi:hypothetical protein
MRRMTSDGWYGFSSGPTSHRSKSHQFGMVFLEYLLAGRRGLKESRSFWQCDRAYSTLRGDDAASTPDHQLLPSIDQCFSESLWSKRHEEAVLMGVLSRIMVRTLLRRCSGCSRVSFRPDSGRTHTSARISQVQY